MGSGRQLLLPDAMKVWQSTELFISGDQRPATVKCRGRDQAISWIAMLKQGAAGENSDISRDWQNLQTKGQQQPREIVNRADIIRKLEAAPIDQKGQLPQRDIGDGQLALLPSFLQRCGGTDAEARWSIGPEQGDVGVTDDPHHHSTPHPGSLGPHRQGKRDHADPAAIGEHLRQGPAPERCGQ
mgnify:CR=1 FL=1